MSASIQTLASSSEFVQFSVQNGLLLISLNRPKALNALDLDMAKAIAEQLTDLEHNPAIVAVMIEGLGGRAFCSGGDVRAVAVANGQGDGQFGKDFFWHEYRMNQLISRLTKPYIALCDGITMGGGIGLSVHGSLRVVSERLSLAMPETAIGLFPDVGSGYFLSRAPGQSGLYLALSGERFGAGDALYLGFAQAVVASADFAELKG
ncbi:MAG: enoyl-CoA hydratase/isomerase family protein, partial [Candidatus Pacebacteria bacterium]|nr:enoyl-CoA hydratase/isomerase family protein [Candidatus Paceibacterota bacterium]